MSELPPPEELPFVIARKVFKVFQFLRIRTWFNYDDEHREPVFECRFDSDITPYDMLDAIDICGTRIVTSFTLTRDETGGMNMQMILDDVDLCQIYYNRADEAIDALMDMFKEMGCY